MVRVTNDIGELCKTEKGKRAALEFQDRIIGNIGEIDKKITRRIIAMILLCLLFIFMWEGSVSLNEYQGIRFPRSTSDRLIPMLISFFYYEVFSLLVNRKLLESVHDAIVRHTYPELHARDMALYLRPQHLVQLYLLLQREAPGVATAVLDVFMKLTIIFAVCSVPFFLVLTMWHNFSAYCSYSDEVFNWVAVATIIFFLGKPLLMARAAKNAGITGLF